MSSILARAARLTWLNSVRQKTQWLFNKHLLLTNVTITVILSGTGDLMQQYYEQNKQFVGNWNRHRTRNVCLSGLFIGPVCHYWYLYLDKIFPGRTMGMILQKVLADQLIISPVCVISFLIVIGYCEGLRRRQIQQDLREKGLDLLKAEWVVWPPAQFVNFLFLPTRFRVLYDNTVSLGFDNYYSYVKYRKDKENRDSEESIDHGSSVDPEYDVSRIGYHLPIDMKRMHKDLEPHFQYRNICGYYYTHQK